MTDIALHLQRFDQGVAAPLEFPLRELPNRPTTIHSPRIGKQHDVKPFDFTKYEPYLNEVLDVRLTCGLGKFPHEFMEEHLPSSWGSYTAKWPEFFTIAGITPDKVETCVEAVRMDTPIDLGLFIMRWLRDKNALKLKQGANYTQFIKTFPLAIAEMSKRINEALEKCFEVKYYYGVARPEQLFEKVHGQKRSNIVSYPAPLHPSYAAGHSAAAAATAQFFYDYFDLDTQDWIDIRFGAYLFGQFRTMAGVHYAVDNLAGLQIGGLDVGYKSQSV